MAYGPALSTARRGKIYVGSKIRDSLSLLDVLYANQFEEESFDPKLLEQTEENFYRGAPPEWLNFHISEQAEADGIGSPLIKRDGYDTLLQQIEQRRKCSGISTVKLFHQPGCGGTTLAMQVLWDLRKTFRCAVLTGSALDMTNVAKEVVQFFTTGNRDQQNTVLLLLNDEHILENLTDSIMEEIAEQKIVHRMPVAILLSCVRKEAVLQSDHVVLKKSLSDTEKQKFDEKKKELSKRYIDQHEQFHGFNIMQSNFSQTYVKNVCTVSYNVQTAETQLAAFLSLLNAYVPGSYLLESQCLDFLEQKHSTFGDLSLEDRMKPFSHLIVTFQQDIRSEKRVRMAHPMIAQSCTELMAEAGVTRSDTARNFLTCFCRDEVPPFLLGFVKDMLTKRETKKEENPINSTETKDRPRKFEKEMFSRLILDIKKMEDHGQSVSVLKVASNKLDQNAFFLQALARFYYLEIQDYNQAEMWAKRAKQSPQGSQNSFIADTLGQVHKIHLRKTMFSGKLIEILCLAQKAIDAFKEEEQLAENELETHMKGGNTRASHFCNTSGHFGYVEVCKIVYDILSMNVSSGLDREINKIKDLVKSLRDDVKKKCDFLNAFLTYSKPGMQKEDDSYNCAAVSSCYLSYVGHPLPDLVMEIIKKFKDDLEDIMSPRPEDTPESYIVAILKGWPTNSKNNSSNVMQLIEKMSNSYESAYAKYFRSRYLRPLFYFGKDDKGDLSIFVPTDREDLWLENEENIKYMKNTNTIFEDLRVQENLFKFHGVVRNYSIFATVGDMDIKVEASMQNSLCIPREVSFFLGFTIRGLVAFDIQKKPTENVDPTSGPLKQDSPSWTGVTPESTTKNDVTTYSLQSEAGKFQCSVSALRWVCKKKVSFTYQFRSWENHRQKLNTVHSTPGGPLLDITVTDGKLDEVYLPHWICVDCLPSVSDKFSVLQRGKFANFRQQVSEVTTSHVKLSQPKFSTNGVLVGAGFPVRARCNVLICKTSAKCLTLHVHLIPSDPALQQELEQKERACGSSIIQKPNPEKTLQMLDFFSLTSSAESADISPAQIQLRHEQCVSDFFTVFINNANSDFMLTLKHAGECTWSCTITRDDYQN